jgi:hypothetical protein
LNLENPLSRDPSTRTACSECRRLLDNFAAAVKDLLALHRQQVECILESDGDCTRFDLLIHMAGERKQDAKYAYLTHFQEHRQNDAK